MMRTRRPTVLAYHGVGSVPVAQDPDNLFVPVEAFAAQLDRLVSRGATVLDEAEYLDVLYGAPAPPKGVLLTFDDGYASVLDGVARLLAERGMSAICFVSPGLANDPTATERDDAYRILDRAGMRALVGEGVSLGCHAWRHDDMTGMTDAQLAQATMAAREEVRGISERAPATFAYPFGLHDLRARRAVARAGFSCAFAVHEGAGHLAIPRVDVNSTDTPRTFDLKLSGAYPLARRALSRVPVLRRVVHQVIGQAERL